MNMLSPKTRLPIVILMLVTAIGIPGATAWAFAEQVVQHPWQALGLALTYEVLVLVCTLVIQVWQNLQGRWVERIADKIDAGLQGFAPSYRNRYLKYMFFRHRNFDVKGLTTQGIYTLELQKVFVELRIAPRSSHEISTDPILATLQEIQGQNPIWEHLRSRELKNLAVIGPPGSGKTTLLKHITLALAGGRRARRSVAAARKRSIRRANNGKVSWFKRLFSPWTAVRRAISNTIETRSILNKIPILLFLRDHSSQIVKDSEYKLETAIHENLMQKQGPRSPKGWFTNQLAAGKCLILLDGLDEVANLKDRNKVVKERGLNKNLK